MNLSINNKPYQPNFKGTFRVTDERALFLSDKFSKPIEEQIGKIDGFLQKSFCKKEVYITCLKEQDTNMFKKLHKLGVNFIYDSEVVVD